MVETGAPDEERQVPTSVHPGKHPARLGLKRGDRELL
jgi:hypothetical protein